MRWLLPGLISSLTVLPHLCLTHSLSLSARSCLRRSSRIALANLVGFPPSSFNRLRMSDSDSDSYWDSMVAAAPDSDGDIDVDNCNNDANQKTGVENMVDSEYYSGMENISDSGLIKAEQDMVWQSLLRSVASFKSKDLDGKTSKKDADSSSYQVLMQVPCTSKSQLMLLSQFLFTGFPLSSSLYHIIGNIIKETEGVENAFVYTDNVVHPSVVIVVRKRPKDLSVCLHSDIPLEMEIIHDLKQILMDLRSKSVNEPVGFMALDDMHIDGVTEALAQGKLIRKWREHTILYCYSGEKLGNEHKRVSTREEDLPSEYQLCLLNEDDAHIINDTWKYKSAHSLAMIKGMIASESLASSGIRYTKDNTLVSWALTYSDRSLGMMSTREEHRNKGLSRVCAAAIVHNHWQVNEGHCRPFCYIVAGNGASEHMFSKYLDFERVKEVSWMGFDGEEGDEDYKC